MRLVLLLSLTMAAAFACSSNGAQATASRLAAAVDGDRYLADLRFIARPRIPNSAHWQAVQDLCFDRLTELGFVATRRDVDSGVGVNVIGVRLGTDTPEERIVVGAHYDSQSETCDGADDNATGVAAALEIARAFSDVETPRTLVIACWDVEEIGLLGSRHYVARTIDEGQQILFNYNIEMIGYASDEPDSQLELPGLGFFDPRALAAIQANENRGDFIGAIVDENATTELEAFEYHAELAGVPTLGLAIPDEVLASTAARDLRRSDHAPFWEAGISALFLGDTGEFRNLNYHCRGGPDTIERLDHDFSRRVIAATVGAVAESLGLRR